MMIIALKVLLALVGGSLIMTALLYMLWIAARAYGRIDVVD